MSLEMPDKVRDLQIKLYRKAKSRTGLPLLSALRQGVPGVDGESFGDIETKGLMKWLDGLGKELHDKTYRPGRPLGPVRRVTIPKPRGRERPLGIPTIRDREAQTAAKLILEPILEADLEPNAYGVGSTTPQGCAALAFSRGALLPSD